MKVQHIGLTAFHAYSSEKKWNNYIESYIIDLGFSDKDDLLDLEKLRKQYKLRLPSLIALAVSQGFESDWKYNT